MLFSVSMFPIGGGVSILDPVTEVVDEIDRAGLRYQVTAMDTVIEGSWDEVMPVLRRAEERLRAKHERVFLLLGVDDHVGANDRLLSAVEEVGRRLGHPVPESPRDGSATPSR
jgi:uncharacterized protein (TIGR00106 family)